MNRNELAKALGPKIKLSTKKTEELIDAFGLSISDALSHGKRVVYSNFGSFYTVHYPSKIIYHPVLGKKKKMVMLPTDVVKWMPSENIKNLVADGKERDKVICFGASRDQMAERKKSGTSEKKSTEITKEEFFQMTGKKRPDDDIIEIPIKVTKKAVIVDKSDEEEDLKPLPRRSKEFNFVDLVGKVIHPDIINLIPKKIAKARKVIPLDITESEILLGMADPEDLDTIDLIKKISGRRVLPHLVSESELLKLIDPIVEKDEMEKPNTSEDEENQQIEIQRKMPITRAFDLIIKRALRDGSSIIHFDPLAEELSIKFRLGDRLVETASLSKSLERQLFERIKSLAKLDAESLLPQTGSFSVDLDGTAHTLAVSAVPVFAGEKIVINIERKLSAIKKLAELDLRETDQQKIRSFMSERNGLALICGPVNSGKTTTAYAMIDEMKDLGQSIFTLEDPVECLIPGINQSQIKTGEGYTFETGLEIANQLDPDAIMVSELPNEIVAKKLLDLASQCRVISTVTARSLGEIIEKLVNSGVSLEALKKSIKLIVIQRIVGRLCNHCRVETKPVSQMLKYIRENLQDISSEEKNTIKKLGNKFYTSKGCPECNNTGFIGKVVLYQVLDSQAINKTLSEKDYMKKELSQEDSISKALVGLVALEEIFDN